MKIFQVATNTFCNTHHFDLYVFKGKNNNKKEKLQVGKIKGEIY